MTLQDDWVRWILGFVVMGLVSALVSMTMSKAQIGFLEKRIELEAAQIREVLRHKEKTEQVTVDGIRNELRWIKETLDRLEKDTLSSLFGQSWLVPVQFIEEDEEAPTKAVPPRNPPPEPKKKQIFDDVIETTGKELDMYIAKQKEGTLSSRERARMHYLEIKRELDRAWQRWCTTNRTRLDWCVEAFGG